MDEREWLAGQFEQHRTQLRGVAYRMLGSLPDAEDAVQQAWLRLDRAGVDGVVNLSAWLTTIVARVSLNMLRARQARREDPLDTHLPDPLVSRFEDTGPEEQTLLADSVGLALQVVLDTLEPDERLAFVLHDMFAVPFEQIAPMLDRTPVAARQLASRARRRVRGQAPAPDRDRARQRAVVQAFAAAARDGDFDRLLAVLHPAVVLRADGGPTRPELTATRRGAHAVAAQALLFTDLAEHATPVLVNGALGAVVAPAGQPYALLAFTITDDRITEIDVLADPDRLRALNLP